LESGLALGGTGEPATKGGGPAIGGGSEVANSGGVFAWPGLFFEESVSVFKSIANEV